MVRQIENSTSYEIDLDTDKIPSLIQRIRDARGNAYSAFSGRPISLCKSLERRGELRVKFEEPIYLWPAELSESTAVCLSTQPIIGVTRDISPHGVGFTYDEEIESDHALAEFDLYGEGTELLLAEIRWTDQLAPHAFVAGGLIVGIAKEVH